VVVRRNSYLAGAIAHSVLGGIGTVVFLNHKFGLEWLTPQMGAFAAAFLATLVIVWVGENKSNREDSLIGAIWVFGMSIGVIFIALTPGYNNISAYLFGDILFVSTVDIWLLVGLDVVIVLMGYLFYNRLLVVCFDESFAKLRGINSRFYYLMLLLLTSVTIVLMVNMVGIVMVIALLTLPAATASLFSKYLWQMFLWSSLICGVSVVTGFAISYDYELPTGPVIVLIATVLFFAATFLKKRIILSRKGRLSR
jgi:zinc transport system permease protein